VLARDDVKAIKPPSTLDYDDSELDVIHACCYFEWTSPPDDATIRAMGDVERRGLWRFWTRPWSFCGEGGYDSAAKSLQTGESFKATAMEMNGGKKPNEAFFLKHFKVPYKTYNMMPRPKRVWYVQLNSFRWPSRDYLWVEANKRGSKSMVCLVLGRSTARRWILWHPVATPVATRTRAGEATTILRET